MLLAKNKLNEIVVLIPKAFIDSYINHDELLSVNNMLGEYNEMEKEIKSLKNAVEYTIWKHLKRIVSVVRKILSTKILVLEELNRKD